MRICTGAYHTCPIYSLYGDFGEIPLSYKRHELILKYYTKIKSLQNHPIKALINSNHYHLRYAANPKCPKPLYVRNSILIKMVYDLHHINNYIESNIAQMPPWNEEIATHIQELAKYKKKRKTP